MAGRTRRVLPSQKTSQWHAHTHMYHAISFFQKTSLRHAHTHVYHTITTGIIPNLGLDDGKNQKSARILQWLC